MPETPTTIDHTPEPDAEIELAIQSYIAETMPALGGSSLRPADIALVLQGIILGKERVVIQREVDVFRAESDMRSIHISPGRYAAKFSDMLDLVRYRVMKNVENLAPHANRLRRIGNLSQFIESMHLLTQEFFQKLGDGTYKIDDKNNREILQVIGNLFLKANDAMDRHVKPIEPKVIPPVSMPSEQEDDTVEHLYELGFEDQVPFVKCYFYNDGDCTVQKKPCEVEERDTCLDCGIYMEKELLLDVPFLSRYAFHLSTTSSRSPESFLSL